MSTISSDDYYFDLHITGLGYLNRIREVKVRKGEPFLACEISAINGVSNAPEYRRFDLRVTGEEAKTLVRRCTKALKMNKKVLVGFRLGDPWVDTFTYSKGAKTGQLGVCFKARLLYLSWIMVDGTLVHKRLSTDQSTGADKSASDLGSKPASLGPGAPYI
ncbi:STY4534 family ICE replication protein [Pseudomonas koreensis]|uniref:STY4534 family ICE replication protein n=1 Tax=Pseudomonas koreensis TaxID=198620 RepID=A0A9X3BBQ4_9PSED|nr:STY4534 family ICE replication protein [Pseudomonas koreensis]MCU7247278.1 STY4534 family ICE replication protein [Pseudomonas koreensis]